MTLGAMRTLAPAWLPQTESSGQNGLSALCSQCTLARNISGFVFPERCTEAELEEIERRVLDALSDAGLLAQGTYFRAETLTPSELRFLCERRLFLPAASSLSGARGVFVLADQSLALMINAADHLWMRSIRPGLALHDTWAELDRLDDVLDARLDFEFDYKFGFLTSSMRLTGTGLRAAVMLHLPALEWTNRLDAPDLSVWESDWTAKLSVFPADGDPKPHQAFQLEYEGAPAALEPNLGALYQLFNRCALGLSEEEIVYHVSHAAGIFLAAEKEARATLMRDMRPHVEDRIFRARGIAREARLLEFEEAASVLSMLRLGSEAGLIDDIAPAQLNALHLGAQRGHIEVSGQPASDEMALNKSRAALFRRAVCQREN